MSERQLYDRFSKRVDALVDRPLNFDLEQHASFTTENGWRLDDDQIALPVEEPGPPQKNGSWAIAKRMLKEYRFADPSIVTGIFQPDTPLEQRVMLLRGRAYGLTFWMGTRIGEVLDEHRHASDNEEESYVWGYNYRTLEGHLERGQMEFTVIKWASSGQVVFRIRSYSQKGTIANPIIRLGFRLLGRRTQRRFVTNSLERMRLLVIDELEPTPMQTPLEEKPPVVVTSNNQRARRVMQRMLRFIRRERSPNVRIAKATLGNLAGSVLSAWLTVLDPRFSAYHTFYHHWSARFANQTKTPREKPEE